MKRFPLVIYTTLLILTAGTACFAATAPDFELYVNGMRTQNNDTISSTPSIEVRIIGRSSLEVGSIRLAYTRPGLTVEVTDLITKVEVSSTECLVFYKPTTAFEDGIYSVLLYIGDFAGGYTLYEATGLRVLGTSTVSLQGNPLNYPNPFDPASGTYISYILTKDSNISVNIYDLAGNNLTKLTRSAGSAGGSAGYNEVFWDGKTGSGQTVGNGMYIYLISIDGAISGKGKMIALKR